MTEQRVKLELETGFTDAKGVAHRRLVFGKRLTGADVVRADKSYGRVSQTGFEAQACAAALVEFGTLAPGEMPHALLSLDVIERAEVEAAYDRFLARSAPESPPEHISDDTVRLAFGVTRDGVTYTDVTFGRHLTGWDEVHADELHLSPVERNYYLLGRQVVRLARGETDVESELTLADFAAMDADDIAALKDADERWFEGVLAAHLNKRAADGDDGEDDGGDGGAVNRG